MELFTPVEVWKLLPGELKKAIKSRLVAEGAQRDRALYEDVSSSTGSITMIFIVLTIAAAKNRHIVTMDIVDALHNAFL